MQYIHFATPKRLQFLADTNKKLRYFIFAQEYIVIQIWLFLRNYVLYRGSRAIQMFYFNKL